MANILLVAIPELLDVGYQGKCFLVVEAIFSAGCASVDSVLRNYYFFILILFIDCILVQCFLDNESHHT